MALSFENGKASTLDDRLIAEQLRRRRGRGVGEDGLNAFERFDVIADTLVEHHLAVQVFGQGFDPLTDDIGVLVLGIAV